MAVSERPTFTYIDDAVCARWVFAEREGWLAQETGHYLEIDDLYGLC